MEAAVNSLEETNARLVEEAMVDKNRIRMQGELLIVKGFRVLILGCSKMWRLGIIGAWS